MGWNLYSPTLTLFCNYHTLAFIYRNFDTIFLAMTIRGYLYSATLRPFPLTTIQWYWYSATLRRFSCNCHKIVLIFCNFETISLQWPYNNIQNSQLWDDFILTTMQWYSNCASFRRFPCNYHTMVFIFLNFETNSL